MRGRLPFLYTFAVILLIAANSQSSSAGAAVRSRGYTRRDGSRVAPSMRTAPDRSKTNNYSAKGRTNPYNGKRGTK